MLAAAKKLRRVAKQTTRMSRCVCNPVLTQNKATATRILTTAATSHNCETTCVCQFNKLRRKCEHARALANARQEHAATSNRIDYGQLLQVLLLIAQLRILCHISQLGA